MNFENLNPMSVNDCLTKCNEIILSYRIYELFWGSVQNVSPLENVKRDKECKWVFSVCISMY